MSLSIGLVGLPNVGKSTLFKAITKNQVETANYPFCTIDPNIGRVAVPDSRLAKISKTAVSIKTTPTVIEFTDIAGLVKNAHKGEGLGNAFLSHIREVDAICQIVRQFSDKNVTHVHNEIDPLNDIKIINFELIMADLATIEKRKISIEKKLRGKPEKEEQKLFNLLITAEKHLTKEKLLNELDLNEAENKLLKTCNLLTIKPMLYIVNTDEDKAGSPLNNFPDNSLAISAKIEAELTELNNQEKQSFLHELGLKASGIDRLINISYKLLTLITFYTAGPEETRAWAISKNTNAKVASAKIHTDISEGFIKAEIVTSDNFIAHRGWQEVKEKGLIDLEGKEYLMQDGDIAYFHFKK